MNRKKGFTLLEILIASIIFVIGVVSIIRAFNAGIFAFTDSENTEIALNIAEKKMEEIKNTAFASLADSGPASDADFPDFSVSVDIDEGANPMQVDVTVTQNIAGGQTSLTLTTLVSNY